MVRELEPRQVAGSVGATLPKDMVERLHLAAAGRVLAVETEQGILLGPHAPSVEQALAIAAKTAKKYCNALRQLAQEWPHRVGSSESSWTRCTWIKFGSTAACGSAGRGRPGIGARATAARVVLRGSHGRPDACRSARIQDLPEPSPS